MGEIVGVEMGSGIETEFLEAQGPASLEYTWANSQETLKQTRFSNLQMHSVVPVHWLPHMNKHKEEKLVGSISLFPPSWLKSVWNHGTVTIN